MEKLTKLQPAATAFGSLTFKVSTKLQPEVSDFGSQSECRLAGAVLLTM